MEDGGQEHEAEDGLQVQVPRPVRQAEEEDNSAAKVGVELRISRADVKDNVEIYKG